MGQFGLGEVEGRDDSFDDVAEPRRFRNALSRSWLLVAAVVVPLTALVLLVSLLLPPTYRASATIVLSEEGVGDAGDSGLVGRELETLERLVTTRPILTTAAGRLGMTTDSLAEKVSASASAEANLVFVTGEDGTAAGAARIANAVAGAFIEQRAAAKRRSLAASRQTLESRIARLRGTGRQGLITSLREALRDIAVEEARGGQSVLLAEPARIPDGPDSPRVLQNTLFALFGFVFIGVLIALAREQIAPRVQDADHFSRLAGVPLLLEMPAPRSHSGRRDATGSGPFELIAGLSELDAEMLQSLLVTSPYREQAAEVIASGVARALASTGEKVALVGGRTGGVEPEGGSSEREHPGVVHMSEATGRALDSPAAYETLIEELADEDVRHLVVVGQPLLTSADGLLQASLADAVVVVGRPDRMSRDDAVRLGRQLRSATPNVVGLVSLGGKQVVPHRVARSSLESARL
jgi:capsular polysaccharide biosynthesis protein